MLSQHGLSRSYAPVGHSHYTTPHRKISEIENVLFNCWWLSMLSDTNIQGGDGINRRGVAKSEESNVCVYSS